MSTMIWSRLKNYKCPVCNGYLTSIDMKKILCLKGHFSAKYPKFEGMVEHLYRSRKVPDDWKELCKEEAIIKKK